MPTMNATGRSFLRLTSLFMLAASLSSAALANPMPTVVKPASGRILIKFTDEASARSVEANLRTKGSEVLRTLPKIGVKVVSVAPGQEKAVAANLARQRGVVFAAPDYAVAPSAVPNDPLFGNQWHHAKIGTPNAWNSVIGLGTVKIAILDTGCDPLHPDLLSKYVNGYNTYQGNSDFSDVHGHGTAVAGSAAAITNNALGVAGVAWNCQIMPIRISDPAGWGYSSTVADGLVYAADHGAKVANISYQFSYDPTVLWACQYFQQAGGVVTISAGNTGAVNTGAGSPYALTVSATDSNDNRASWSTWGPAVDISAPGVNIQSTNRGGGYGGWSGTSFSAPVTAGVAALVISANEALTASEIQDVLTQTAVDRGAAGWDQEYGWGRVNADAAVALALSLGGGGNDTTPPTVSFIQPTNGATVSGTTTVHVNASDNVGVASVSFYVNGALVATDTTAPYEYSWDTLTVANGGHNLRVEAKDAADNVGSAQIGVTVSNQDTTPPVTAITTPRTNSRVRASFSVTAAADDNVGVVKVELYVNGVLASTDMSAPWSFSVNGTSWANGVYTLTTKAYDAQNNVGVSTGVKVKK
jgi:subtilisin family serine protease